MSANNPNLAGVGDSKRGDSSMNDGGSHMGRGDEDSYDDSQSESDQEDRSDSEDVK